MYPSQYTGIRTVINNKTRYHDDLTASTQLTTIRPMLVMSKPLRQSVAVGLTTCLLLLSGLVYPQTVAHAAHHAHHKAATHATALCSLLCAAGQVLEGVSIVFQADRQPVGFASLLISQEPASAVVPTFLSRGPPLFSV